MLAWLKEQYRRKHKKADLKIVSEKPCQVMFQNLVKLNEYRRIHQGISIPCKLKNLNICACVSKIQRGIIAILQWMDLSFHYQSIKLLDDNYTFYKDGRIQTNVILVNDVVNINNNNNNNNNNADVIDFIDICCCNVVINENDLKITNDTLKAKSYYKLQCQQLKKISTKEDCILHQQFIDRMICKFSFKQNNKKKKK